MTTTPAPESYEVEIIVKPDNRWFSYRARRLAMVLMLVGYGCWSLYDGFVRYPRENADFHREHPAAEKLPHPGWDIPFNQVIGLVLPPVGLALLAWTFYATRGQFRFANGTIHAPGHLPVSLDCIIGLDRFDWDRKGIFYVEYQLRNGKTGSIKLDEFLYEDHAVQAMYKFLNHKFPHVDPDAPPPLAPDELPAAVNPDHRAKRVKLKQKKKPDKF